MIIECVNCNKKFEVNSELIPLQGRTIQCGSCNHIWFYKPVLKKKLDDDYVDLNKDKKIPKNRELKKPIQKTSHKKALVKYEKKSSFTLGKFLRYILVFIISFVALIILLDTFKSPLEIIFPNLELVLYNLYETLKDIILFIKDLT